MGNLDRIGRGVGRSPDEVMSDIMDGQDRNVTSESLRNRNALGNSHDDINDYIARRTQSKTQNQQNQREEISSANNDEGSDGNTESETSDSSVNEGEAGEDDTHQQQTSHHTPTGGDSSITFLQRLILMGVAFLIIATVGRYAWNSLWFVDTNEDFKTNAQKISIDVKENYDKLMGKDVNDSENNVKKFIGDVINSNRMEEVITSYTMDEVGLIHFKYENLDETVNISSYPGLSFNINGGYIELEVYYDSDNQIINYKIVKSGGSLDADTN